MPLASTPHRDLELVAAVVAGEWLEISDSTLPTHTTARQIILCSNTAESEVRASVLAQAALAGADSLRTAWAAGLRHHGRRNRIAERYVALEVPRALRDRSAKLPGLADLASSLGADWPSSSSAQESLRRARARELLPEPPVWFGRLSPTVPAREVAENAHHELAASETDDELAAPHTADVNPAAAELTKIIAELAADIDENWLLRKLRRKRRGSAGSTSPESSPKARSRARRRAGDPGATVWRTANKSLERSPLPGWLAASGRGKSRLYPEFDIERRTMRPDHCTVYDIDAKDESTSSTWPQLADAELRRRLARVVLTPAPSRRRHDGDEVDVEAALDARANFVATGQFDDRVWMAPRPRRPGLAVMVLVDMSGSVSSTASGISTHRRQVELAEVISDALYAVGARLALCGFRSQDRRNVELVRILPFGRPWDESARRRLHACEPCGFTRLGAVVRRSSDIIDEDGGAARRVLILVSDGVAYDSAYEGGYAEADTRRALREANTRGIATLCVTVGADTSEGALDRVFGPVPRVRARAIGDLRLPLAGMIHSALISASRAMG
ncbi:VWA domain-containing protein [Mycobacterium sp. IS-1264]|uniref:nitric oxide reductase activation protein NorD n=1 Tax=Mycobacterium sp. IS-1264 TaxID=1834158 RepID=UPI00096F2E80|nr:VWA domain-containing protein [Mycobacterium sp. IS-1264]OMC44961.1 hypothetical protein A5744_11485 [Mycobacterium sp. IS-1264]